jgi:hypothetical protein
MMQGHGAKIIDTSKNDTEGTDARLLDKLVTAVGKNQTILNSSLSPPPAMTQRVLRGDGSGIGLINNYNKNNSTSVSRYDGYGMIN